MKKQSRAFMMDFLLSPRMRWYRHLLLCVVIFFIVTNVSYISSEANELNIKKWILMFFYSCIFIGIFYSNIYWAVPHFLLRNRIKEYILFMLSLPVCIMLLVMVLQRIVFTDFDERIAEVDLFRLIINIISSILNVVLFSAGVSAFMLLRHWILSDRQISELQVVTQQSELDLLKEQVNPHFLFNMLNNANVLLKKDSQLASLTLFKLEDMLHYQMKESNKEKVLLDSDIHFLEDFLQLEKIRRDNFEYNISAEGNTGEVWIPPLLFIPFVENAVKYSQDSEETSFVHISFLAEPDRICFMCINSKPVKERRKIKSAGLGLKNIQRRLELLYPQRYTLDTKEEARMYVVKLEIRKEEKI